jgi:hypothetical protein
LGSCTDTRIEGRRGKLTPAIKDGSEEKALLRWPIRASRKCRKLVGTVSATLKIAVVTPIPWARARMRMATEVKTTVLERFPYASKRLGLPRKILS